MSRMASHDHFLPKKYGGIHAYAHKEAVRRYYRILCHLDDNPYAQQDEHIRLVIEQLLIILLGTYSLDNRTVSRFVDYLFGDRELVPKNARTAEDETARTEDIGKDQPDAVDKVKDVKEAFESFRDRSTATSVTLASIGFEVCERCGWQPITARSDSNGQFGTDIGSLNQFSPIDTTTKRRRKARKTECETTEKAL